MLIQNGTLIDPKTEQVQQGDILVEDGVIAAIGQDLPEEGAQVIDATGLVVAPGLIDMHVHLRDPGQTKKEDIYTGCKAAAAGGVTGMLAMPNTYPTIDSPETIRYILDKAEEADSRVYVAAAITHNLESGELNDLKALRDAGAVALSDDGRPVKNTRFMAQAMKEAPTLGMRVVSHCEDLDLAKGGIMNEGEVSRDLGVPGIPAAAEDCGTAREIALAAAYNVPIHICHVSTRTSVALIRDAKRRGVQVTAETAPHYLTLTDEALRTMDANYRMNPPLRTEADRLAMIEGIQDGTIDAIATDHAPHTPEEKSDFRKAPNGVIGMETSFAASYTALVHSGILTLPRLLRVMSYNPAKILGIPGGVLQVGEIGDLILIDENQQWIVDENKLHGKSKNAVFKGAALQGKVKLTICKGRVVYQDETEA
ncbi:MAG: dihydroorotase [Oscillospiraceae bacterium]|nr:dihydroorotase [Oscillospiraceae bacterium]